MIEPNVKPFGAHLLAATAVRLTEADAAWVEELATIFGKDRTDAMAVQLEGRGQEGSRLRALYDKRQKALADWRSARGLG
ncbi:hypothetical protein ASF24_04430 [Methylobacterium sp. Leaf86]|uniref:hypothetical protein n=1 Tax=Methylobacterium sp. Leaf86 TaxID=1736242 RepID=UPI0006F88DC6|nr:hypothetical protein [Methylobacterium sp. Leaf86]KQO53590.1 hypothetical protein ASF24_04430 [Methylobacterium sp. Leaf86]